VTTSDKVVVIERKNRVGRVEELGVEDYLDSVRRVVEKLYTSNLVQDRVLMIVEHIMGDNWGKSVTLHGKETTAK
jgi:hypothetical protein